MKNLLISFIFVILAGTLIWPVTAAQASWLIDAERFHISAHGQLSCQDCHSDISEKRQHPDPADVNKTLQDFFSADQCTVCHEDVLSEVEDGSHGGETLTERQLIDHCIECHHPHYQVSYADNAAKPDLNRPAEEICSRCHKFQPELPEYSTEDQACMDCHTLVSTDDPQEIQKTTTLCFHCHSSDNEYTDQPTIRYPLIEESGYTATPHANISCMVCHPQAAEFRHFEQKAGDCGGCHQPHDEKVAHDAHAGVTCGACHLNAVTPVRDSGSKLIRWQKTRHPHGISPIHQMLTPKKDASCHRCHTQGNSIGAAVMVLPAKSIICMPCHTATFSIGDTITIVTLILLLAGIMAVGSVWLSGGDHTSRPPTKASTTAKAVRGEIFSTRILAIVKSLILDGLLQRRLLHVSRERWLIHALIFYPFIFRLLWGLVGLGASLWRPDWSGTWVMLDKNHPVTAFLFDFSGMIVLLGVIGAIIRRIQDRMTNSATGLPAADWPAYGLLGGIMVVGFILEGIRMAMTDSPGGAPYAFIGDAVSRTIAGFELTGIYGYVWYLHAVLTGAFVVYLPFSRMFHMVMAPVVMAMNAAGSHHRGA